MALIKCPECKKDLSDEALACPHCGYKIKSSKENFNVVSRSVNSKYYLLILILVVGGFLIYSEFFKKDLSKEQTNTTDYQENVSTPKNNNDTTTMSGGIYKDQNVSFQVPSGYQTYKGSDGLIYVAEKIDSDGAYIPYIMVAKYTSYNNCVTFLNDFTSSLKKSYPDVLITISLLSNYVGDHYTYGIQYTYTSSGHKVVDNRYATLINNVVYMIGTKEENVNTTAINNAAATVISSISEGSK